MNKDVDPVTQEQMGRLSVKNTDNEAVNLMQNGRGQWIPAIPLPFYGLKKGCWCGRKFWTEEGYRAHYALKHILDVN